MSGGGSLGRRGGGGGKCRGRGEAQCIIIPTKLTVVGIVGRKNGAPSPSYTQGVGGVGVRVHGTAEGSGLKR